MRSWIKALLISAVILASFIFFLPSLAKQGLNSALPWAMEQADLEQNQFHISRFSWRTLQIEHIQFYTPEHNASININGLHVNYSPWELLTGELRDITVNKAQIEIHAITASKVARLENQLAQKRAHDTQLALNKAEVLSDTASDSEDGLITLTSLENVFQQLPLQQLTINEFEVIHPQGRISAHAELDNQQLVLTSQLESTLIKHPLSLTFSINHRGELSSALLINKDANKTSAPIFNLQGQWTEQTDNTIHLGLQQSADIQSWLDLLSTSDQNQALTAAVAIQAWNLGVTLPTLIESPEKLLGQLTAQGLLQIQINDFNIRDLAEKTTLIENANLTFNLQTDVDQQLTQQWLLTLNTFDLSGAINNLAPLNITLKQDLKNPLIIGCALNNTTDNSASNCTWQGDINQTISADNITHTSLLNIDGKFNKDAIKGNDFISRQTLTLNTQQHNALWPKANNKSHGNIILQAQQVDNDWHWQLNLPFGFQNQSEYLEKITLAADNPSGKSGTNKRLKKHKANDVQLSAIQWQLLPDWQLLGINGEITSSKALSVVIDELKVDYNKSSLALKKASLSCNLDWLKLQYSPQLRSKQSLSQLPLFCDWELKNKLGNWQQWPVPALTVNGQLNLSAFDFNVAKLDANVQLTGLANNLDLTLLAQHNFAGQQQGKAQLYLNNLKLDWKALGLTEMEALSQVQLLAGSLSAQGWFQWQQYQTDIFDDSSIAWRWQPDVMLRIDDLAGVYQEITTWEDIDVQLALRRPFYQDFRIDSQISALSLHPGIEVSNILARSTTTIKQDLSQALIVIEEVHSNILGGRINVPLIRFDTSEEINSFGVEFEGIEIEQLAALEAGSGINATGKLDGVLPMILLPAGPQVPAGSLYARSPGGVVQYRGQTAENLKDSDPSVNLAMQVLDDFRYHTLRTDVTYQPNGELKLGLKFQGHNPTFFDGQETHFNLNLDYNLLDLLESLRISNDIVQKLENKYQ